MNELATFLEQRPAIKRSELARELGVSSAFIHSIEKGIKKMPADKIERLRRFAWTYGYQL
jgi:DNA-binding XRE family transcriptional regulator